MESFLAIVRPIEHVLFIMHKELVMVAALIL